LEIDSTTGVSVKATTCNAPAKTAIESIGEIIIGIAKSPHSNRVDVCPGLAVEPDNGSCVGFDSGRDGITLPSSLLSSISISESCKFINMIIFCFIVGYFN
jgi:hypothetical protein